MSRFWQDYIPILNEYQRTKDDSFPNFPLGTDYSNNYSVDKENFLLIGDAVSEVVVSFKAFIKDFSISFKYDSAEVKQTGGGGLTETKGMGVTYNLKLDIPSISVDDAMVNAARLDAIMIMMDVALSDSLVRKQAPVRNVPVLPITPTPTSSVPTNRLESAQQEADEVFQEFTTRAEQLREEEEEYERRNKADAQQGEVAISREERSYVLFSNLIHNGKYDKKIKVRTFQELAKYSLPCYITKLSFNPNLDMGFFEYDYKDQGIKLFPKVFETSLELRAILRTSDFNNSHLLFPYDQNGNIQKRKEVTKEKASWPFGVSLDG